MASPRPRPGLLERTGASVRVRSTPSRPDVVPLGPSAAVLAAVQAAVASLAVVLAPVVLTWVSTGGGQNTWTDVLQLGGSLWLATHHVALAIPGGHLGLFPLGALAVPMATAAFAGARLARTLDPRAERIAAGSSSLAPTAAPRSALAAFAITYGAIAMVTATICATKDFTPVLWQAALAPAALAAGAGWLGSQAYAQGGWRYAWEELRARVPLAAERFLGPVVAALSVQLIAGALVLGVGIVLGFSRIGDLYAALQVGFTGAVIVTLLQVLLLPNLIIWGAAWLTGPGFSVGDGSAVTLAEATLGPLPAVPVLGALPDPGPMPGWLAAGVFSGVIAGAVAGYRLIEASEPSESFWAPIADLCLLTLAITGVFTVLLWASGGAAGPGRLSQVGPVWACVPAFALEVAIGAGLVYVIRMLAPALSDAWADR